MEVVYETLEDVFEAGARVVGVDEEDVVGDVVGVEIFEGRDFVEDVRGVHG